MNGYLIARFDMTDPVKAPAAYKKYVETAAPAYADHHARFLVRGGEMFSLEGDARARNVVIEYPSVADALACYRSAVYQKAREHRLPVAEGEIVVVEGAVKARPAQKGERAYWISRQDVREPTVYRKYAEAAGNAIEAHQGIFLVRNGPHQAVEGQGRSGNVLIEFPSIRHALDCFHSDAYQAALKHRRASSIGEIVVVAGA